MPKRGTLGARRLIAPAFSGPGITKSHGKDRISGCIIEDSAVQLHPVTQAITAGIIPRYATSDGLCLPGAWPIIKSLVVLASCSTGWDPKEDRSHRPGEHELRVIDASRAFRNTFCKPVRYVWY